MNMAPAPRKLALTIHLAFAVGWVGAVMAYLSLAVSAVTGEDTQTARAALIAMELIGWFVIVPLALATLLIGLVMALGTPWGLFRHYWVLITFVLTIILVVVLVRHMPTVSELADAARGGDSIDSAMEEHTLQHAGGALVLLVGIMLLNVYKPRGMTRLARRKDDQRRQQQDVGDSASRRTGDAVGTYETSSQPKINE